MKKEFILVGLLAVGFASAQSKDPYEGRIGINTMTPSATMNIKSLTGTDATTKNFELENANGSKMVTVLDNGNVGIGTDSPTEKLDVNGNARVRQMPSGTDEATYPNVVVADANGNLAVVSRTNPTVPGSTQTIFGTKEVRDVMQGDTFYSIQADHANKGVFYFRYTGQSITLPPGKWIVYNSYLVETVDGQLAIKIDASNNIKSHNVWARGIIDDNPNAELKTDYIGVQINGSPALVSTNISPDQKYNVATGLWFVDNTTSTDKTYYVKVSFEAFNFTSEDRQTADKMSHYKEDYLVAIRRE